MVWTGPPPNPFRYSLEALMVLAGLMICPQTQAGGWDPQWVWCMRWCAAHLAVHPPIVLGDKWEPGGNLGKINCVLGHWTPTHHRLKDQYDRDEQCDHMQLSVCPPALPFVTSCKLNPRSLHYCTHFAFIIVEVKICCNHYNFCLLCR